MKYGHNFIVLSKQTRFHLSKDRISMRKSPFRFTRSHCTFRSGYNIGSDAAPRRLRRNRVGTASEPSRNRVGTESGPSRNRVGNASEPRRNCVGTASEPSRNRVGTAWEPRRNCVGTESEPSRNRVGAESEPSRNRVGTESEPRRNRVGTESELSRNCVGNVLAPEGASIMLSKPIHYLMCMGRCQTGRGASNDRSKVAPLVTADVWAGEENESGIPSGSPFLSPESTTKCRHNTGHLL